MPNPPLLTVAAACQHLAISRATLYRLMGEGTIRPVRIGGSVRFRPSDLEAFVDECLSAPDPDAAGPRAGIGWAA